ncbi:MAG: phosphatidylserine decarboxylase [Kofleriaceae bacterium]|nr:phosphatidylserine decarboxylase [Myxococcales bacterium]MCB9563521.1 phosphatidylserine decarboxylase [Kofleriaceae bacterium]
MGWYASLVGWGARRAIPRPLRRPLYGAFSQVVGADLAEADRDPVEFRSFGEMFARRLRPGARSFDLPADALACPSDGALAVAGPLDGTTLVQAKGKHYTVGELLADDAAAAAYAGGWYCTIYLSPANYHRVHAPLDGEVVGYDYVPGAMWPVSRPFVRAVDGLFARNERAVIHLATAVGPIAVVMVGATGVGNLWLEHLGDDSRGWRADGELRRIELSPRPTVRRGDELGAFLLGSTVVLLAPAGVVRPAAAGDAEGELVAGATLRCGQPLARVGAPGGRS